MGLQNLWLQQDTININLEMLKQRIIDQYCQSWYSDINNSNRQQSYSIFKLEQYLDKIQDKILKTAPTKFSFLHDLATEKG